MRSVKFLVAAGAASLLSSAAFAADMPIAPPPQYYAPPPAAEFGGWYLRGDIGFSNQRVRDVRLSNPAAYAGLTSFNQQTGFDTAGIFGIGVGYQFNNWLRGDITGQYRGNSNFKGTDRITGYASDATLYHGIDNYSATKSEWLVLANAYVDLGTWWCVTPFIGAGVGMARVNIANFTDTGAIDVYDAGGGNVMRGGVFPSYASAPSATRWNLAWALHAGLAYQVSPGLTLELAYSYVNLGNGATGAVSVYNDIPHGHAMEFHDITSHDVKLGVRWELNSPPAYAPPLVTKG